MIGLTIIAFVLTVAATTASLTGLIDAEMLSIVAVALAAFTISCVIASWLTWEPRHQRDRVRRSLDGGYHLPADEEKEDAPIDTGQEDASIGTRRPAQGPRGWPW
ncbi:MAG: hypothetical protein JWM74_937 [Myxococcaceae bacterium]|nr:hypothetical protein [Myxococcaceae bacterium]